MATKDRAYIRTVRGDGTSRKGENNMGIPWEELKGCNLSQMKSIALRYGYRFVKAHDGLVEFEKEEN